MESFIQLFFSFHDKYYVNLNGLCLGALCYFGILYLYDKKGGMLVTGSNDNMPKNDNSDLIHYTTIPQAVLSTPLFLSIFWHLPTDTALSLTLAALVISVYLFLDKNLSWSVARTNTQSYVLANNVRQLQGIESLPDLKAILIKITDILSDINKIGNEEKHPEVYLVCASPALGALHEGDGIKDLSNRYKVAITQTAEKLKDRLKIVHYHPDDALPIFANEMGLDESRINDFVKYAKTLSDSLKQLKAAISLKDLNETIAKTIFSPNEIPSSMLFHMLVLRPKSLFTHNATFPERPFY